MKKFLSLHMLLLSFLPTMGKGCNSTPLINQTDSIGLRTGGWIDDTEWIGYYKNGLLDGPVITTVSGKNGFHISEIGVFSKGENQGSNIMFHPNGVVSSILTNLQPNTDFKGVQILYGKNFDFKYQSYSFEFYPNGKLQAEGWYILGEEIEIDFERVGVWKFYSEDGTVEDVDFSDPNVETKHSR